MSRSGSKGAPIQGSSPATRSRIWRVTQQGFDTPMYSMKGRPQTSPGRLYGTNPSPDAYNIRSCIGEAPKYHFGLKLKGRNGGGQQPGPAEYDVSDAAKGVKNRSPSYSFGGRHGNVLDSKSGTPGPDMYQSPRRAKEGAGFSMTSRRHDHRLGKNESPGPGAYSPDKKHMPNAPAYSLTAKPGCHVLAPKSKKAGRADLGSPGPGAYKPLDGCPHKPTAARFSMGRKLAGPKAPDTPGPIYSLPNPFDRSKTRH